MEIQTEFPQQVMFQGKCTCTGLVLYAGVQHETELYCLICVIYPCVLFSPIRLGAQIIWTVLGSPPPAPLAPLPT